MRAVAFVMICIAGSAISSCNRIPVEPDTQPTPLLDVSPAPDAFDVPLRTSIELAFGRRVDAGLVVSGMHLMSASSFVDSLCPIPEGMVHAGMDSVMLDHSTVNHLVTGHAIAGSFWWSVDSLKCVFTPDSALTPSTQYMIHMDRNLSAMLIERLGDIGPIRSSGMMDDGDISIHFMTAAAQSSGGGHNGHH